MKYSHLSLDQRYQIQYYHSQKISARKIATIIGVCNSTISRELKRNAITIREPVCEKYITKYEPNVAQKKYTDRRATNRSKATESLLYTIYSELKKFNSITSIVGKYRVIDGAFPSSTTLYHWIKIGVLKINKAYKSAYKLKRTKRKGKSQSHMRDNNTKNIHERPNFISHRKQLGHWELDLVESAGNGGYIISFIERTTRFTVTKYIEKKTINNVNPFIHKIINKYKVNSITTDNGNEFLGLYKLKRFNKQLEIYYCDPGAPYQKGQVEWFNKQLRRFIKKNDTFTKLSIRRIKYYTKIVNNQALKVLNYHSPMELEFLIKK